MSQLIYTYRESVFYMIEIYTNIHSANECIFNNKLYIIVTHYQWICIRSFFFKQKFSTFAYKTYFHQKYILQPF